MKINFGFFDTMFLMRSYAIHSIEMRQDKFCLVTREDF